jgi:hypothetical protein
MTSRFGSKTKESPQVHRRAWACLVSASFRSCQHSSCSPFFRRMHTNPSTRQGSFPLSSTQPCASFAFFFQSNHPFLPLPRRHDPTMDLFRARSHLGERTKGLHTTPASAISHMQLSLSPPAPLPRFDPSPTRGPIVKDRSCPAFIAGRGPVARFGRVFVGTRQQEAGSSVREVPSSMVSAVRDRLVVIGDRPPSTSSIWHCH